MLFQDFDHQRRAYGSGFSLALRLQAIYRDGKAARLRLVIMRRYNACMSDPTRKLGVSRAENVI
ncbi:MAG: hypothetical protein H5U25_11210 [Oceanibaculum nanhaiense]|nr:hypothetical protein [Oceanibaculum nanhaiense]